MGLAGEEPLPVRVDAGDVEWQAIRVIIYPWSTGIFLAVERREGRGGRFRDRRLLGGPLDLGERPDTDDLGAVLRAASDALAHAADGLRDS